MKDIASKIGLFNFSNDLAPMLKKFFVSLSDNVVTYNDLKIRLEFLESKGIKITRPSQIKVLVNDLEYLKQMVANYEAIGELKCLIDDPTCLNSKNGFNRMQYIKNSGEEYKMQDGKYLSLPFKKRQFEAKYGAVNFATKVTKDETYGIQMLDLSSSLVSKISDFSLEKPLNETKEDVTVQQNEEMVMNIDPLEEVLSKPKRVAFNDETFEKYNNLYEKLQHIWITVYNEQEISDSVIEHLNFLVTSGFTNDFDILYKAITYGKTLPDAECEVLKNAILDEIEYDKLVTRSVA